VFWPNAGGQTLLMAKSTDGGSSFTALGSSPVQIASTNGSFTIKIPAEATRATSSGTIGTLIAVSGGAYRTATDDLVFACWHDLAGGTGCSSPSNAPGTDATATCKTRVWFASSTDGGQHWSTPVKINDQSGKNDQFFPRLAVDELTGHLMVVYYDTVGDSNRVATNVWMQYSTNGGTTWSPAVRVSTQSTTEASSRAGPIGAAAEKNKSTELRSPCRASGSRSTSRPSARTRWACTPHGRAHSGSR